MEVMSPQALWKDFDRKALPLDISAVSERIIGGYRVTDYYFSAMPAENGIVRAYAKLYVPLSEENPPVIVYFNDIFKDIEETSTIMQAMEKYAFLKIDYAGEQPDRMRYTLYPKSLKHLNYYSNPALTETVPEAIKTSCWYVWTVMAARAKTFLEEIGCGGGAGILGVGEGGSVVYKTAFMQDVYAAGMTIYGCENIRDSENKSFEFTSYKAALDSESYAPYIGIPLLMEITSNESSGSIDHMNEIYSEIKNPGCRLSIVERSNRSIAAKQRKNCVYWFDFYLKGIGEMPAAPTLGHSGSESKLYFDIEIDNSLPVLSVDLYVAQAMENGAYRNWSGVKIEKISENSYIARVPVYEAGEPLYAFVNVKYEKNMCISCPVTTIIPESLKVQPDEIKHSRLIYDGEMGTDDWIVLNDNGLDEEVKLVFEEGPFGISGVGSITGSISTFKIGDFPYRSFPDCVLQLLLYSETQQKITFAVTVNDDENKAKEFTNYTTTKTISPNDNWLNVSLAAGDFKSKYGTLASFKNVATLEIQSEKSKVLISSVLWV